MDLLDKLQKQIKPGQALQLDAEAWFESGLVIAGSTHLPLEDQLVAWAKAHNFDCVYKPRDHVFLFYHL